MSYAICVGERDWFTASWIAIPFFELVTNIYQANADLVNAVNHGMWNQSLNLNNIREDNGAQFADKIRQALMFTAREILQGKRSVTRKRNLSQKEEKDFMEDITRLLEILQTST